MAKRNPPCCDSSCGHIIATITGVANITGMGLISEDCGYADAVVHLVSPGLTGVEVGDAVKIWDASLCWFNLPVSLLEGLRVVATLYRKPDPDSTEDCATAMLYEGDNVWIAQGVCCAEGGY